MTNEVFEQRDSDVRQLDQQPGGLARCGFTVHHLIGSQLEEAH
ncbi:hypothetical protein [Streptomyces griseorubiginosus]|nr:hypothetical protein [Streptomyces griseorubiginosus]